MNVIDNDDRFIHRIGEQSGRDYTIYFDGSTTCDSIGTFSKCRKCVTKHRLVHMTYIARTGLQDLGHVCLLAYYFTEPLPNLGDILT